jgi:methylglutaconyl-CoA hydratase
MEQTSIDFNYKNNICHITLNRPEKHNAFNEKMINALSDAFNQSEQNADCRAIILNAAGTNFCAGADLHWMQRMSSFSQQENEQDALQLARLLEQIDTCSKPVIALAQGRVIGGGIGIIACCDLVIASEDTKFCFSEVKLGLIPATIAPYVIRKIGCSAARRFFITAETFNVDTASRLNLVHEILPAATLQNSGIKFASQLFANSPNAMSEAKKLVDYLSPVSDETIEKTAHWLAEIRASQEGKEGLQSFLKKRAPNWQLEGIYDDY